MIITRDFRLASTLYQKQNRSASMALFLDDGSLVDPKFVLSIKYNAKIDDSGMYIGTCIPKQLNITLTQNAPIIPEGETVSLCHTIYDEISNELIYTPIGQFYVISTIEKEQNNTRELLLYDVLHKLKKTKIIPRYPTTIRNILEQIEDNAQINFFDYEDLEFLDYTIQNEIHFSQETTAGDIIRAIAQMHLRYVATNYDGSVGIKRPHATQFTLNNSNVFAMDIAHTSKPINSVVISRQPQNDDVFFRRGNQTIGELKIINNPILDLDREAFVEQLLTIIEGESFTQAKIELQANPLIEAGDMIHFQDLKGKLHKMLVTEHDLDDSRSVLTCTLSETTETNYKRAKSLEKRLSETELYVDKVKNEIGVKVAEINETVKSVVQTFSVDAIETKITSYIETNKANLFDEVGAVIRNEPPINTNVIWFDTVTKKFKVYDDTSNEWQVQDDTQEIRNFFENELSEIKGEIATKQQVLQVANDFLNKVDLLESYRQAQNGKVEEIARKSEMFEDLLGQVTTSIKQTVNGLEIGKENSNLKLLLGNNRLSFKDNDVEVAYISNQQLVITSGVFLSRLVIGRHTISTPAGVTGTIIYYSG